MSFYMRSARWIFLGSDVQASGVLTHDRYRIVACLMIFKVPHFFEMTRQKKNFGHSDCTFLLHFWNKLGKYNNFGMTILKKQPNLSKKIIKQFFASDA
jgi:hypothetical protein